VNGGLQGSDIHRSSAQCQRPMGTRVAGTVLLSDQVFDDAHIVQTEVGSPLIEQHNLRVHNPGAGQGDAPYFPA
jgi:hypothetical protein